jgi:hypothetical protein
MTDSQISAAAARCWIDAETPVRRPKSNEWTKLGDAAPAKRISEEADIETSAMILLSGEFELVTDEDAPSKDELASARPPRLAPKLFVAALAVLAGGGVLAHRYVPRFDAEVASIVAAMRPAPMPTPAAVPVTPTPVPMTVASSATLAIVPKMIAPAPKMREPSAPPAPPPATKKASSAKAKPARKAVRH